MIISTININCGRFPLNTAVFLCLFLFTFFSCNSGNQESSNKNEEKVSPKMDSTIKPENQTTSLNDYSDITCPKCGFTKNEKMPTDVCLIKYACTKCKHEMVPDKGDCCVFCTYGTHKCPSMQ